MKQPLVSRRTFLFAATAGTAVTAAAIVGKKEASPTSSKEKNSASQKGYQLTDHVRNYYRTAKI